MFTEFTPSTPDPILTIWRFGWGMILEKKPEKKYSHWKKSLGCGPVVFGPVVLWSFGALTPGPWRIHEKKYIYIYKMNI